MYCVATIRGWAGVGGWGSGIMGCLTVCVIADSYAQTFPVTGHTCSVLIETNKD
jgi:hypothetical protein